MKVTLNNCSALPESSKEPRPKYSRLESIPDETSISALPIVKFEPDSCPWYPTSILLVVWFCACPKKAIKIFTGSVVVR